MLQVSETFRQNCYDPEKAQRMLFLSDDLCLSNEDISAQNKVRFNISSITSTEQVQFGCTPYNTVNISVLNEDGRITTDSIVGKEFKCSVGVEVSDDDYLSPRNAITAVDTGVDTISVHSVAPYIRGNCAFGSVLPQLMNGDKCKIMYLYDVLYFVVFDGEDMHYAKHTKVASHSYSEYEEPTSKEKMMLDRLMNISSFDAVAYYEGGMAEFTYFDESTEPGEWATATGSVISIDDAIAYRIKAWNVGLGMTPSVPSVGGTDFETWSEMKQKTWGMAKTRTWGMISGYSIFKCVHYESVQMGLWHFDRPRKVNAAVLTLSGRDRMVLFDEDSAQFVASVPNGISFTPRTLIQAIASFKSVPVGDLSSLNELADEIRINGKTYYQNKSLKDLLSYAFEVCGANGIIDRYGRLSASSASNTAIELPFVYAFDVADYTAHTIGKMLTYRQGDTSVYETDSSVTNGETYDWTDNPFFNNILLSGSWFSNNAHKKYGGFRNAITATDADYSMWCDDVYSWTDEDGNEYVEPIFSMSIEWGGSGRVTYANYGGENRKYASYTSRVEGTSNINDQNLQGFNKAQYANRLFFDEQGLTVQSNGLRIINQNDEAVFYADDEGNLTLKGTVDADAGHIGEWNIVQDGIKCGSGDTYIFLGYDDYHEPIFMSKSAWGVTPSGANIGVSKLFGADLELSQYIGDSEEDSATISLETSGKLCATKPWTMYNVQSTATSANAVLVQSGYTRTIYVTSSLRAIKDNIKTIEDASKKVDNLRGVSFTSKCEADDPNVVLYGLIAEEVEKAVPELATYEDGKLQGVQYDRVCALLIEDNKACHRRIEELEKRLDQLERRLDK